MRRLGYDTSNLAGRRGLDTLSASLVSGFLPPLRVG